MAKVRPGALALLLGSLLLTACSARSVPVPASTGRPPAAVSVSVSPVPESLDVFLTSTVRAFRPSSGSPSWIRVDLATRRSVPTPSGESSLSAAVWVVPEGRREQYVTADPEMELLAVTATGTVVLDRAGQAGPPMVGGFQIQNRRYSLPRGTTRIVLVVRLGPTEALARDGIRLDVPLKDIPVVDNAGDLRPWGIEAGLF